MAARFDFNFEDRVPEGGPISDNDLMQMETDLQPENMIADQQRKQAEANERLQALKMQRLREENEKLLATTQQQAAKSEQLATDRAFLEGQLSAIQKTIPQPVDPALQFDEEELAAHGHAKGFVSKVAKIEAKTAIDQASQQLAQGYEQRLAAIEAKYAAQLEAHKAELNNINGTIKNNFESEVRKAVKAQGLDYEALVSGDETFLAYASRPLAVGANKMWGAQLEENIEKQDLNSTVAMFEQYAKYIRSMSGDTANDPDAQELPPSTGARPLSPQAQSNVAKRQSLMAEADRIQDQFLAGTYPGTQEEYQIAKAKLLSQADDIPLPV